MDALENPFWHALATVHRQHAIEVDDTLHFPADMAPFLAIERAGAISEAALASALAGVADVLVVGPRPTVPAGYQLDELGVIVQMVCAERQAVPDGDPIERLSDQTAIRALAALVYPHYFRARTAELGRYWGIGSLDAMVGERMAVPGAREISAVCTHPQRVGRGLARRLLAHAGHAIFDAGEQPFLHVSPANARAVELYERNGYRPTRELAFYRVRRSPSPR